MKATGKQENWKEAGVNRRTKRLFGREYRKSDAGYMGDGAGKSAERPHGKRREEAEGRRNGADSSLFRARPKDKRPSGC